MHLRLSLLLLLLCYLPGLVAQEEAAKEVVSIDHADELRLLSKGTVQRLVGAVELSQDSIFMYCDSAELVSEVQLYAYDKVVIQQGDSIAAFSEYLD